MHRILPLLLFAVCAYAAEPLFETTRVFPFAPNNKPNYRIPSIIQAPNGDILIITEKRNDGPGDIGNHDIVLKRSSDKGKTWSAEQVVFDDEKRVCTDLTIGLVEGKLWIFFLRDKKRYVYLTSSDSGATWEGPRDIHEQVTKPEWDKLKGKGDEEEPVNPKGRMAMWEKDWFQRYGCGPGNALVQLKSGRILVPARHREDIGGGKLRSFAHSFYSDDKGATWKLGGNVGMHTSECQFVELANGDVMVISRNENSVDSPDNIRHLIATSSDGGVTWKGLRRAEELISPRCHGSTLRLTLAGAQDKNRLLFSSPASPFRQKEHPYGRYNLTVRVSYDEGATWSAGKTVWPHPGSYSDMVLLDDNTIAYVYERAEKGSTHYWDELHFARFNLEWLTEGRDSLGAGPLPLTEAVRVGTKDIPTKNPPAGFKVDATLGLMMANAIDGQVVHRTKTRILETRATITPKGDYLLLFPEGDHYAKSKGEKINSMMVCRSTDKGRTWSAPKEAFDIPYGQHGFIPLTPRGTKRIYAFGTQPIPGKWTWEDGKRENAPIGYRWSDDDGHTWSDVKLIEPKNDPTFMGMSVMRMTETDAGTWLLGSHLADWSVKPFTTRQYILRSEDRGQTWEVVPGARPNGWIAEGYDRMDEGRPLNLGGGNVLFMSRTPAGQLFTAWSEDDGKSWTKPAPSSLVHPDAPPMLFPMSDGKTLAAFHHNKVPPAKTRELDDKAAVMKVRSELWVAFSTDGGKTWTDPRFVLANAVQPLHAVGGFNFQCSYVDAFTENGVMHLFMPHRWQQVLHLTIKETDLLALKAGMP